MDKYTLLQKKCYIKWCVYPMNRYIIRQQADRSFIRKDDSFDRTLVIYCTVLCTVYFVYLVHNLITLSGACLAWRADRSWSMRQSISRISCRVAMF